MDYKKIKTFGIKSTLIEVPIWQQYLVNTQDISIKRSTVLYNPAKGSELSQKIIAANQDLEYFALKNLTPSEIITALDTAKIYIDFGHFPGKDRIPREALARNCVIFLHDQNCGSDYETFPIDNYFRFTKEDILNGTLCHKIQQTLNNFDTVHAHQAHARNQLAQEYEKFCAQVYNLFGRPIS